MVPVELQQSLQLATSHAHPAQTTTSADYPMNGLRPATVDHNR